MHRRGTFKYISTTLLFCIECVYIHASFENFFHIINNAFYMYHKVMINSVLCFLCCLSFKIAKRNSACYTLITQVVVPRLYSCALESISSVLFGHYILNFIRFVKMTSFQNSFFSTRPPTGENCTSFNLNSRFKQISSSTQNTQLRTFKTSLKFER